MFLSLSQLCTAWESEDALVLAGSGLLAEEIPVHFAWLGNREIAMADVRGLNRFMASLGQKPDGKPLLLLSETPGFRMSPTDETAGMVLETGRYRRFQQELRDRGTRLVAVAHCRVVGGTFLAHGMAAIHRLVTAGSTIYGTLPPLAAQAVLGETGAQERESLEDALKLGLFTEVIPESLLSQRLKVLLARPGFSPGI